MNNNNNFSLAFILVFVAILIGMLLVELQLKDIGKKIEHLMDEARSLKIVYIPCNLLENYNKVLKYTQKDGEATIEFIDKDKVLIDKSQQAGSRLSGWHDENGEWIYMIKEYDQNSEEIFKAFLKSNEK